MRACVDWQANFAEKQRELASKWYELSDEDWAKYTCKCPRRTRPPGSKTKDPAAKGEKKPANENKMLATEENKPANDKKKPATENNIANANGSP